MAFISDQVRRIDAQFDRVQLARPSSTATSSPTLGRAATFSSVSSTTASRPSIQTLALQAAIRALSPGSSDSSALLPTKQIHQQLSILSTRASSGTGFENRDVVSRDQYEEELEWLLVSKATTQVYGVLLKTVLDETVALTDDIYYWDSLLSVRAYTALYGIQISPFKLWNWSNSLWQDVAIRARDFDIREVGQDTANTFQQRWSHFYGLVKLVIEERSVSEIQNQVLSPVTRLRVEMRQKQAQLKRLKLRNANALGLLLGEGLANESAHGDGLVRPDSTDAQHRWKASVSRNVALMAAVLARVNDQDLPVDKFDTSIEELTDSDPFWATEVIDREMPVQPVMVAERLMKVLSSGLPEYASSTKAIVKAHGRPSRVVRYWLPVVVGLLSSSTALRILVNRRAEMSQWARELGTTLVDFWRNWVVDPTRKVIQTIRHDEGSEVSIMSKRSLEGDRASLERMVVDFAVANPQHATGSSANLTADQIADIRFKVKEGDLTPVLRAYEKDLASPFMGALMGNLVRALLIQIQKTKVDVEIAIGGIDSLLKSQELVFGFIGLTPGILVTYFALRSLRSSFTESRGSRAVRRQGTPIRQLRNIDRILTNNMPTADGELFYRDQGLLICEVHVLRQAVEKIMPTEVYREFSEDAEELCDVRVGVQRQRLAAERIRWAYQRFIR